MIRATLLAALCSSTALGLVIQNPDQTVVKFTPEVPEGFNVDLSEMRLVQFDEADTPVWISELDKVKFTAHIWIDLLD